MCVNMFLCCCCHPIFINSMCRCALLTHAIIAAEYRNIVTPQFVRLAILFKICFRCKSRYQAPRRFMRCDHTPMMQWPPAQMMYFPVHAVPSSIRRSHQHFSDDAADSDDDFHPMELRRSLMTLRRCDKIKVIEFTDPDQLTACRLSQLTDVDLRMLCFLISPTLCVKTVSELGVGTMAAFKRVMSAHAIDNSLMSRLVKQDLSNLAELAVEAGWTTTFGVPDFNSSWQEAEIYECNPSPISATHS